MFGSNDDKKTPAAAGEKKSLFGWLRKKPQQAVVEQPPAIPEPAPAPVPVIEEEPAPIVLPIAEPVLQPVVTVSQAPYQMQKHYRVQWTLLRLLVSQP